jgi:thymidylate kinase
VCQERLAARGKVELYDGQVFQVRVRESYIRALEYYRGRGLTVFVVNGDRPAGIIHGEIWNLLAHLPISRW